MKNITNIPGADKDIEIVDYIETPGVSEEDELLQAPASNLGWAITFKDPASFVDQMAADDFTYELPDSRKFCGKHVLDKELYASYLLMRSAFYHKNHCLFVVLYNCKVCPVIFAVYANENDPKQTRFKFKAIRVNRNNNIIAFHKSVFSMRELPWREARVYDSMVQQIMDPMFSSHDAWMAWGFNLKELERPKPSREAKLLRRQLR